MPQTTSSKSIKGMKSGVFLIQASVPSKDLFITQYIFPGSLLLDFSVLLKSSFILLVFGRIYFSHNSLHVLKAFVRWFAHTVWTNINDFFTGPLINVCDKRSKVGAQINQGLKVVVIWNV